MVVFEERGNRITRRKPLGVEKVTNKLNPHKTQDLGIEPGPHWLEASALIPAPLCESQRLTEIHVWRKRNTDSISGSQTTFSKYSMSGRTYGSPYFVHVELIQIEKNALYCAMFCKITKMLLNAVLNSATARQCQDSIFRIVS